MKKMFSFLIAALILALGIVPAVAASDNGALFTLAAPAAVKAGDTVNVKLSISGGYEVHLMRVNVFFETRSFRFESIQKGAVWVNAALNENGFIQGDISQDGKSVNIGFMMPVNALSSEGEIATLSFTVLGTALATNEFTVSVEEFGFMPLGETHATSVGSSVQNATVTVQGGATTSTNPTTRPIDTTPNPGETDMITPEPGTTPDPDATVLPTDMATREPGTTQDPNETNLPIGQDDPDATEPTNGDQSGDKSPASTKAVWIYVGCGVLALAAAVVAALLIAKNKRNKNK